MIRPACLLFVLPAAAATGSYASVEGDQIWKCEAPGRCLVFDKGGWTGPFASASQGSTIYESGTFSTTDGNWTVDGVGLHLQASGQTGTQTWTFKCSCPTPSPTSSPTTPSPTQSPTSSLGACTTEGEIRLVDGPSANIGRLEVCHDGVWGTVCDDRFSGVDGRVVCLQLGYSPVAKLSSGTYSVSDNQQPIWLDDVQCDGSESDLTSCSHAGWGMDNCGHHEDVNIECAAAECTDGEIRLVDGPSAHEGRLEVCHFGSWGTVCDDGFSSDGADVACRQLGFVGSLSHSSGTYGTSDNDQLIWLDDVVCNGNEAKLWDCPHNGWGIENCGHHEDVNLVCDTV